MKWALLVLACVSFLVCYQVGELAVKIGRRTGSLETVTAVESAAASTYSAGAIGAGIIGGASVLGAALIQASENKKKD